MRVLVQKSSVNVNLKLRPFDSTDDLILPFTNRKLNLNDSTLSIDTVDQLRFIDILPRNPAGKVQKFKLKEQFDI